MDSAANRQLWRASEETNLARNGRARRCQKMSVGDDAQGTRQLVFGRDRTAPAVYEGRYRHGLAEHIDGLRHRISGRTTR